MNSSIFTERPATYGSKSPGPNASKMVPSIIGEDLRIRGNVTSKGEIQVDGEIEGDIRCGSLLLGDKSKVTAGVPAEDVVVRGHIVGSVRGLRITELAEQRALLFCGVGGNAGICVRAPRFGANVC
jgi:predicted acyltransferase (DUF342 family)